MDREPLSVAVESQQKELPPRHIIPNPPQEYLYQHGANCGPRAIKGILSSFGKDTKENPVDYNKFWLGKKFGQMLPHQMVSILEENGLEVEVGDAGGLTTDAKLRLLKEKLYGDSPVVLLIGNGYDTKGRYWRSFGAITKHYVTVYGYDDTNKEFYVYDPCVKKELQDRDLPIGNIARSYDAVLRDWNYGVIPGIGRNVFVSMETKE
jgi:hypothetical protein